ncbi:MAG: sensor histidine kinase [Clostridiaceae bacterium]
MNFFSRIVSAYRNLGLKTKLLISYIILISIITVYTSVLYYRTSAKIILTSTENNIQETLRKNNMVIDQKMKQVEESTKNITVDEELYNIFNADISQTAYELFTLDRKISKILYRYFTQYDDIYQTTLITSYYTFNDTLQFVSQYDSCKSKIYKIAQLKAVNDIQWVPTYFYKDMYENVRDTNNYIYPYMFSAVKVINFANTNSGYIRYLDSGREKPVLVVSLKEDTIKDIFRNNIYPGDAYYTVLTDEGRIVTSSAAEGMAAERPVWLDDAIDKGMGSTFFVENGRKMLVCYDTCSITGWISAMIIPVKSVLFDLSSIRFYTFYSAIILVALSVIIAYFISGRITEPIKKLLVAIQKSGEGKFTTKIDVQQNDEMGYLIKKFNEMNDRIQVLINENFVSRIKEKEAEITALNMQMNPHFLYNTLNIINWVAIENGQKDISRLIISLSTMLQYTTHNKRETVEFHEDLEWLKSYVYLLANRFRGKFSVNYNIESSLLDTEVPKLFLQPFIENAIIHGFEGICSGGVIVVSAWIEENLRYFCVEDNGKGMDDSKFYEVMNSGTDSIGICNIDRRVKLLYGEGYGVRLLSKYGENTRIGVVLPNKISKNSPPI